MKIFIFILVMSFSPWCLAEDATASGEFQIANNETSATAIAMSQLQECAYSHAIHVLKDSDQYKRRNQETTISHAYNQAWNKCIDRDRLGDGLKAEDLTRITRSAVEKARREAALPRST